MEPARRATRFDGRTPVQRKRPLRSLIRAAAQSALSHLTAKDSEKRQLEVEPLWGVHPFYGAQIACSTLPGRIVMPMPSFDLDSLDTWE